MYTQPDLKLPKGVKMSPARKSFPIVPHHVTFHLFVVKNGEAHQQQHRLTFNPTNESRLVLAPTFTVNGEEFSLELEGMEKPIPNGKLFYGRSEDSFPVPLHADDKASWFFGLHFMDDEDDENYCMICIPIANYPLAAMADLNTLLGQDAAPGQTVEQQDSPTMKILLEKYHVLYVDFLEKREGTAIFNSFQEFEMAEAIQSAGGIQ
jgi:hypothetical protein